MEKSCSEPERRKTSLINYWVFIDKQNKFASVNLELLSTVVVRTKQSGWSLKAPKVLLIAVQVVSALCSSAQDMFYYSVASRHFPCRAYSVAWSSWNAPMQVAITVTSSRSRSAGQKLRTANHEFRRTPQSYVKFVIENG